MAASGAVAARGARRRRLVAGARHDLGPRSHRRPAGGAPGAGRGMPGGGALRRARGADGTSRTGPAAVAPSRSVFVVASMVTAARSLDATVVLLTPSSSRPPPACARPPSRTSTPARTSPTRASLLLPVSNLTNLVAFPASGLSFSRFAGLMALPTLDGVGRGVDGAVALLRHRADRPRVAAGSPADGRPGAAPFGADGACALRSPVSRSARWSGSSRCGWPWRGRRRLRSRRSRAAPRRRWDLVRAAEPGLRGLRLGLGVIVAAAGPARARLGRGGRCSRRATLSARCCSWPR